MSENKKAKAEKAPEEVKAKAALVAKKDFEIHQNDYHLVIKAGDNISDVPEIYIPNLKSEGVL